MSPNFNVALNDQGEGFVSFVSPQGVFVNIPHTHQNFARITDALLNGEDVGRYLSLDAAVHGVDRRCEVIDGIVFFQGEPQHSALADAILRYQNEGRNTTGLVRFLERLANNPSKRSRDGLWQWIQRQGLSVDEEGYLLGFKSVNRNTRSDAAGFAYQSSSQGTAWVDGVEWTGAIPQNVGSVVTMPRPEVDDNFEVDCSYGLHVGTYGYARTFASILLDVRVDPADVVTVPDYDTNKLRCCRYEILAENVGGNTLGRHEAPATWSEESLFETLAETETPKSFVEKFKAFWRSGE